MQMMEEITEGCIIEGPQHKKWEKNMLGFVDDTRKFNNQNTVGTTLEENVVLDLLQWKKVSSIVAGKLNLKKCGSYILTWKYDNKGNLIMDTTTDYSIQMPVENNKATNIKLIKSSRSETP